MSLTRGHPHPPSSWRRLFHRLEPVSYSAVQDLAIAELDIELQILGCILMNAHNPSNVPWCVT